jgi:hypothetical protein
MRALLLFGLVACSYNSPQNGGDDVPGEDARRDDAANDAAVDTAVVVDTLVPDAPFEPATDCPGNYAAVGALTSRYRLIDSSETWPTHFNDCANDLDGKTHLVVLDNQAEINALAGFDQFLVGHIQMPNQATAGANWFEVTGDPIDNALWLGGQPNDNLGGENNAQNHGFIDYPSGAGVQDGPASFQARGLCECDGKPIPPAITAIL